MIELSKCPTCASEDRVTIAGKDFCMHCGTPSEDNAMISATDSGFTQGQSSMSKFSNAQPQAEQSQPTNGQALPQTVAVQAVTDAAPTQTPLANIAPAQPAAQSIQTAMTDPASPAVQGVATTPAATPAGSELTQPKHEAITQVENKINELSATGQPQTAVTAVPAPQDMIPISTLPQDTSAQATATAPDNKTMPTDLVTPVPVTVSQDAAAVATPAPPNSTTANAQAPESKTMPGSDMMTLDKKEPGVFSDEELHALSNTAVENPFKNEGPSEPPATPESPNLSLQSAATAQTTQPTANQPQPTQNQARLMPVGYAAMQQTQAQPQQQPEFAKDDKKSSSAASKVLKPVGVVASIALVFAVGFYMWRSNYPGLAFKIASSKAGISASMPGYVPQGYNLAGNIQASPGNVSYSLASQGNKKIVISQSKTDWDSQALAENYVAPKADNYLALQAQGLTIYMLGSNQASWVNKGTWYRIESPSGSLTQDQVIKMATSL